MGKLFIPPVSAAVSWTPTISFATPGTMSATYTTQWGEYYRLGNLIMAYFNLAVLSLTAGTASGALNIAGLPLAAKTVSNGVWSGSASLVTGVTKASYTQFLPRVVSAGQVILVSASGSGQTATNLVVADIGGSPIFQGSVVYPIA